jgi:hypothetical protein
MGRRSRRLARLAHLITGRDAPQRNPYRPGLLSPPHLGKQTMKIKIEGALYFRTVKDFAGDADYMFLPGAASDFSRGKVIAAHTIEVDAPEGFDPRAVELEALKEKRKQVHDAFAAAVMEIDQRINSLLAIENEATPA